MSKPTQSLSAITVVPVMDPSLLATLCKVPVDPALQHALSGSGRLRARIAAQAVATLGMPSQVDADDSSAMRCLAFAKHQEVELLLRLAGGLTAGRAVRQSVDRDAVVHLRTILGDNIYAMVLAQNPLPCQTDAVPLTQSDVRAAGLSCLADWFAAAAPSLSELLSVRFDADDRRAFAGPRQKDGRQLIDIAAGLLAEAREADA